MCEHDNQSAVENVQCGEMQQWVCDDCGADLSRVKKHMGFRGHEWSCQGSRTARMFGTCGCTKVVRCAECNMEFPADAQDSATLDIYSV